MFNEERRSKLDPTLYTELGPNFTLTSANPKRSKSPLPLAKNLKTSNPYEKSQKPIPLVPRERTQSRQATLPGLSIHRQITGKRPRPNVGFPPQPCPTFGRGGPSYNCTQVLGSPAAAQKWGSWTWPSSRASSRASRQSRVFGRSPGTVWLLLNSPVRVSSNYNRTFAKTHHSVHCDRAGTPSLLT